MVSTKSIFAIALAILSTANTISGAEESSVAGALINDASNNSTSDTAGLIEKETELLSKKKTTTAAPTIAPTAAAPTTAPTTAAPTTAPTTAAPTTAPTTAAPTTVAPTTGASTTVVPTTVPPHPKEYMWTVKDPKTNMVCIIAEMKIQLDIPYTNATNKVLMAHVKVPGNASASGTCNSLDASVSQSLTLQWSVANATSNLTLVFSSNTTSKQFWLKSISADIVVDNKTFPGIKSMNVIKLSNNSNHFITPMDNSYSCPAVRNIPVNLTLTANETAEAYFSLDHFQLQAFKNSTSNGFSSAIYCEGDNTPDLVPILVGCTLVGLVLIVLGVYLWGRRRSQQRGYLSM